MTRHSQLNLHIAEVIHRVEVAMGDEQKRFWPVKLAALLHEMSLAEVEGTLRRMGFGDVAQLVCDIIGGFGEIWKISSEAQIREYVFRRKNHLELLLLFEVAHEGAATDAMRAAARLGGCEENLEAWVGRLTPAQGSLSNFEFTGEGKV